MDHHRNFPTAFYKFVLRDILHYTKDEIRNLNLVDYQLALYYALETYVRRDIKFVMSKIYGKKKGRKGKKTFGFTIEHPEIEAYIKESYNKEESE